MLSISGSNFRKSVADWTVVNIHYFYKEEWICVSISDSLLVSLICQSNLQTVNTYYLLCSYLLSVPITRSSLMWHCTIGFAVHLCSGIYILMMNKFITKRNYIKIHSYNFWNVIQDYKSYWILHILDSNRRKCLSFDALHIPYWYLAYKLIFKKWIFLLKTLFRKSSANPENLQWKYAT